MRKKRYGDSSSITEEIATNIGFYYHSITEHITALATQAGDPNLVPHIARRLAALLEAEAIRTEPRTPELVPQVWANGQATGRRGKLSPYDGAPGEALHVRPRDNGTLNGRRRRAPLSAESIAKIAAAQRARWRKWHKKREARRVKGSARYEAQRTAALNKKRKKIGRPTNTAQSQRAYWAQFTPEERSAMMAARRQAAIENRKGK